MNNKKVHFKLNWTLFDIIAISITLVIAIVLSIFVFFLPSQNVVGDDKSAKVMVYYDSAIVASENLIPDASKNESDPRYIIMFPGEKNDRYDKDYPQNTKIENLDKLLGDLIIEINNKSIQIVKETSPNHICSNQGSVNVVNRPLTGAPNYVIVKIISNKEEPPDIIL